MYLGSYPLVFCGLWRHPNVSRALYNIQSMGAKTDIGLIKRIVGIVAAFLLGRRLLVVKGLFA